MANNIIRQELESDIAIRERNLTLIKTMPTRYAFRQSDLDAWIRCSFPIIYSEWEGYFVNAMTIYIRQVNLLNLTIDQLNEKYVVNNTEKRFKQLKQYPAEEKYNQRKRFLFQLKDYFRNMGSLSLNTEINTESNLGFNVTNAILSLYDIKQLDEYTQGNHESLKDTMNEFLLHKRNGLAHGDPSITVTTSDITRGIQVVTNLMNVTKENIIEAFENRVFEKTI